MLSLPIAFGSCEPFPEGDSCPPPLLHPQHPNFPPPKEPIVPPALPGAPQLIPVSHNWGCAACEESSPPSSRSNQLGHTLAARRLVAQVSPQSR